MGYMIGKFGLEKLRMKIGMVCVLAWILFYGEYYYLINYTIPHDYNMYVSLLLVVPCVFFFINRWKIDISDELSDMIRRVSIGVFFIHEIILILIWETSVWSTNSMIPFLFTVCLSIIISAFLVIGKHPLLKYFT
ncbi:MAG: hypothetical protein ACRC5C_03040, partial [Bacilli bacterium]